MNVSEKLKRFVQGTVVTLTLSFLVVGYVPSISFGSVLTPSYGVVNAEANMNYVPGHPGDILVTGRDYDNDGVLDYEDNCMHVCGTSSQDYVLGCPDDDSDGWANTIDVCPNNSNH